MFQNNGKTHFIHILSPSIFLLFILVLMKTDRETKILKPIMLPPGSEAAPEQQLRST